jgi:predicted dehydrogenase
MEFNRQILSTSLPVYIIGAGGIVNDAHLPAYKMAGFNVQGIYDIDKTKACDTAKKFNVPGIFDSLVDLVGNAPANAVFDIAVPAKELVTVLEQLPAHAHVLMQKPMGEDIASARRILEIARNKKMTAAVNFQLRYAPFINHARKMIEDGLLGELNDIEINVNVYTPWPLWKFLYTSARVEILYHSIHYIDLVRSFFGNPASVYAKTTKHKLMSELASVRSNIIMDYGEYVRANILTNHCHDYGSEEQQSYIKFEGTKGAIKISLGLLKNYPAGGPDRFEYTVMENGSYTGWKTREVEGSWFPQAFIGSMQQVMLAAEGIIDQPDNSVEDSIYTMACVEAAYRSSEQGGVRVDEV